MAAVPIGFERWTPGEPWGDVVHDDGTRISVPDPDGSIEAEARQWGARFNSQPKAAPTPTIEPSLTGAASPPLPPSTPSPEVPAAPPLPSGAPLTASEKAPLQASPEEQRALEGRPGVPATGQSPAAQALADHGVDPNSLPRAGAPGAPDPLSPALAAVQQHAPQLVAGKAEVKSEGPDAESAANIRGGSDLALQLKGRQIDEQTGAKSLNNQDQAAVADQDYFNAWRAQQQAMGQQGALTKARDDAANKLAEVKQAPIADHPDFPDWFVASSILGSIAGGFAEGFSGGRYKSTTLPMLQQIVTDWQSNQRYNKTNLISSLEQQLGDKNAAMLAGASRIKDELANMAESKAKYARTVEAQRELTATATGMRASALEDWTKAQAVVMGKASESVTLEPPKGGPGYTNATLEKLKSYGVDPKLWEKALGEQIKDGRQNAPSVAQTAASVKQIDSDRSLLQAIAAANPGGTLPTRGAINIPPALVPTLARLGYSPGMKAEEVGQILGGYVMGRARSYGGAVTESDAAAAEKETGKTTEGVMRYLDRLRNQSNRALTTELGRWFPGREQPMLDILLDRASEGTTPGVPSPPVAPLEKQNVEHTSPVSPPRGEMKPNASLNVSPEEQARIDADVAQTRAEEERQRAEGQAARQAEVDRRRERPIPGSKL